MSRKNPSIDLTITTSRVVGARTEITLLPEQATLPLAPLPDFKKSERQDSNLRSPGPRPGAMTKLRYVLSHSTHPRRSGLGGARTLVCGSSGHRYTISATSPKPKTGSGPVFARPIKKARCLLTPGLQRGFARKFPSGVRSDLAAWAGD